MNDFAVSVSQFSESKLLELKTKWMKIVERKAELKNPVQNNVQNISN